MNQSSEDNKKQDIFDKLTWDDSIDAHDINVSVLEGVASLEGTVPSYSAKMAAEGYAYQASDVTDVRNNLTIDFPTDEAVPSDIEIATTIEKKLKWNSQINARGIDIDVTNGKVILSGVVDSYWEKLLAGNITFKTRGIIDVANNLAVTPVKSINDIDIENDIRNAFRRNGITKDDRNLKVSVNGGIVKLSGILPNYLLKTRAIEIAAYTSGVKDIVDDIKIE
ncbi:MAG: BON domain-containing protein [Cyclobacteriaceae bacterium]